jgi:hypothetical protein
MSPASRSPFLAQVFSCWNWKCALLSASARSLVYLAALARSGRHGRLSVALVEIAYVAVSGGLYAAVQQRALGLHSRDLGNAIVALGVPVLAQAFDWLAHRAVGGPVPARATIAVSFFAAVSALFHLFVMRRGAFLTNHSRSLFDDLRRMPRLVASFMVRPVALISALAARPGHAAESEAAL